LNCCTDDTGRKQAAGKFQRGKSGNPAGRPRGSRNTVTLAVEALLQGEHEALTRRAIEMAKSGDIQALKLCLDRLAPARRDSLVSFVLPKLTTARDAVRASAAIVAALAGGELTPSEATAVSSVVQNFSKIIETVELEDRIRKLEEAAK
jgi:Family of unknown function (DUF5681)